jgi:hypothetical protein
MACRFFEWVEPLVKRQDPFSDGHLGVDGTRIDTRAAHASFLPKGRAEQSRSLPNGLAIRGVIHPEAAHGQQGGPSDTKTSPGSGLRPGRALTIPIITTRYDRYHETDAGIINASYQVSLTPIMRPEKNMSRTAYSKILILNDRWNRKSS